MLPETLLLAALIFSGFVLIFRWRKNKRTWDLLGLLPGPRPLPLLGNVNHLGFFSSSRKFFSPLTIFLQSLEGLSVLHRKQKMFILWLGLRPTVVLFGPETLEPIMKSHSQIEKGNMYDVARDLIGNSLPTSSGKIWKLHRKVLNPAFNIKVLDNYLPIMNYHAKIFVQKIKIDSLKQDWMNVSSYCSTFSFDVVNETTFGIRSGTQESKDTSYMDALDAILDVMFLRIANPILMSNIVFLFTKHYEDLQKALEVVKNYSKRAIKNRMDDLKELSKSSNIQSEESKPETFLDFILQYSGTVFDEKSLREHVDAIVAGGYETTYTALTFALYSLGLYKEVQNRARQEIDQIFGEDRNRDVTDEDLRRLKYLECLIKESQRVFPTGPFVARKLVEDLEIGEYTIPKDTDVLLVFYLLHHDPDVFPEPEVFDPERFLPENSAGRHPCAYIPFSSGPRNCIGQRYAMMEMKVLLCQVLRHFKIHSLDQRDKLVFIAAGNLRTEKPIRVTFKRR